MAVEGKWKALKQVNRYLVAVLFTVFDSGLALVWVYAVLVLLGQAALRPTTASAQNFFKAAIGGPSMLFIAAAWVGLAVWLSETYIRTKDVYHMVCRFFTITAVELLLFPFFNLVMIMITGHVFMVDALIILGTLALAGMLWQVGKKLKQRRSAEG